MMIIVISARLDVCFLYRQPRAFIETPRIALPFFICITTFVDIRAERVMFHPSAHLDKLIVAQLPPYTGSAWDLMSQVPLRDMILFVDEFPGFYRATVSPPPPYSMPPPPHFAHNISAQLFTPPPPNSTQPPFYTPASPDNSGYSPSLITFPPTPRIQPPVHTPTAPTRPGPRARCPGATLTSFPFLLESDSDNEVEQEMGRARREIWI